MKAKFLRNLLIILGPFGIMLALVNVTVDPANVFSTNVYVEGIAKILSSGHNVDNISNYDERLLQEQMIVHLKSKPDIVILGSSRIMQVGADYFPGKNVLNCGVSHANIRDIIAIVGLLDSLKKMPEEVIINVDPGLICTGATSEWQSIELYYKHFLNNYLQEKSGSESSSRYILHKRLVTLFSLPYFQSAIQFLGKKRSKAYQDIGSRKPVLYGRFSDGTVSYTYDYMHPDSLLLLNTAIAEGKRGHYGIIDTSSQQLLENLLDVLLAKKIKIKLCMLPYYPGFFKAINEYHNGQFEVYQAYFKVLARKKNIPIVGSFNPSENHFSEKDFYDDSHSSKESLRTILIP